MKIKLAVLLLGIFILSLLVIVIPGAHAQSGTLTFAAFGDYGVNDEYGSAVASMVAGWNPDLIVSLGDNYYADAGGVDTEKYDLATGKYYCNFLKDITTTGTWCPTGQASTNRFFPALGDHDYDMRGRRVVCHPPIQIISICRAPDIPAHPLMSVTMTLSRDRSTSLS